MNNVGLVLWPRISTPGLRSLRTRSNYLWKLDSHQWSGSLLQGESSLCASLRTFSCTIEVHRPIPGLRSSITKPFNQPIGARFATHRRAAFTKPVPRVYTKQGLDDLSQEDLSKILGPSISVKGGIDLLHRLQLERSNGTLDIGKPGLDARFTENVVGNALAWLRVNSPIDEDAAIIRRLDAEDEQAERELQERAVKLGIYKPQQDAEKTGIYGESGIDAIHKHYEQQAAKSQADEVREAASDSAMLQSPEGRAILARKTKPAEWVERYKAKALLSNDGKPPIMTKWARLYPSALVVLLVVGISVLVAQNYVPSPRSARLFPDVPPAAATVLTMILGNVLVFIMWRAPPLWRFMNKYFLMIPGAPKAWSMVGNTVSHQSISHLFGNMAVLWFIGTRLHDDIGRGNFLAVYFSSGVLSSFFSLSSFVLRNNLITSSLGASGAMAGVIATWCSLHSGEKFSFIFLPAEWNPTLSSNVILFALLAYELVGIARGSKKVDHWAHLGGYMTGLACAQSLKHRQRLREQAELDRRKKLVFVDHIKEGRI